MAWLKASDKAGTHPIVLRGGVGAVDPVAQRMAVFGFVLACALNAAAHETDYFIEDAVTQLYGAQHAEEWSQIAERAGYWQRAALEGRSGWQLVDEEDLFHIRLKAEVDWDRQRQRDASDPALVVPVRLRDGDVCRYCRRVVNWNDHRGGRGGTYDHCRPGRPGTVDTYVVACKACNSGRRDRVDRDQAYPLQPAPTCPYYHPQTVAWLAEHGHTVTASASLRPGTRVPSDTAPRPSDQLEIALQPAPSGWIKQQGARPDDTPDPVVVGGPAPSGPLSGRPDATASDIAPVHDSGDGGQLDQPPARDDPSRSYDPLPTGSEAGKPRFPGSGRVRDGPGARDSSPSARRRRRASRNRPQDT